MSHRRSLIALVLAIAIVLAAVLPAQSAITYGRWREISPTHYSAVTPGTLNGVYIRSGGTGAIGAGDGWAVGGDAASGPLISHYDGFSWQIMAPILSSVGVVYTSAHFCTAPGAPSVGLCSPNGDGSDGWIVGTDGTNGVALYWDGLALTQASTGLTGATKTLNSVFMACHSPQYGSGCPGSLAQGLTYAVGSNAAGTAAVIYSVSGNPKSGVTWTLNTNAGTTATSYSSVYMFINQAGNLDGFAVGTGGEVARFTGGIAWSRSIIVGATNLLSVFVDRGSSPIDAWAVDDTGQIWHFNGSSWGSGGAGVGTALNGIFLVSTSEGWIVGAAGKILHSTNLNSGNTWTTLSVPQSPTGSGINLNGLSFAGGSNGWAVGQFGVILNTQNSGCAGVTAPCWGGSSSIVQSTQLNAIAMTGSNDAWAGGLHDIPSSTASLIHWDGNKWHRTQAGPINVGLASLDIFGIYMLSSSEGWAVGGTAAVAEAMKWDGSSWQGKTIDQACACEPQAVFMVNSNDGWIVGASGRIWRFTGTWTGFQTVAGNLNSVFIDNPGNNKFSGWAVGGGPGANTGVVYYLDQTGVPQWIATSILGVTANLYGVYFKDSSHGWIVGDSATVLTTTDGGNTWSGSTGQVVGAPATTRLFSVFVDTFGTGAGNGDGWAVGVDTATQNAIFAHWDGLSWTYTPLSPPLKGGVTPFGMGLHSVFLTSPVDGFAVGQIPVPGATPLSGMFHLDPPNPPTVGGVTTTNTIPSTSVVTSTVVVTSSASTSTTSSSTTSSETSSSTSQVETSTSSTINTSTSSSETSSALTTSVVTSTATSVSTFTPETGSTTTPLVMPAVPGFPLEAIVAGILVGLGAITVMRRRRTKTPSIDE